MFTDGLFVNVDTSSAIFFPSGNVLDFITSFFSCNKNDLKNGIKEEDRKLLHQVNKKIYIVLINFMLNLTYQNNMI